MHSILWHFDALPSTERCVFTLRDASLAIAGTVLTRIGTDVLEIRYRVTSGDDGRTRSCRVDVEGIATRRSFEIASSPAGWMLNGGHVPALEGAIDVDLGFSPSTNTLPIRRLGLRIGESARITAAWLRFPQLELVPSEQVYTRTGEHAYRYESGDGTFCADLDVDAFGIVTRFGSFWRELIAG
jgi:uncharacterized protein